MALCSFAWLPALFLVGLCHSLLIGANVMQYHVFVLVVAQDGRVTATARLRHGSLAAGGLSWATRSQANSFNSCYS